MDKRFEKTEKAIKGAFLKLREKRPLEKISVKELCEIADINKSTFYSHYEDIYALSDTLEHDLVYAIISSIPRDLDYSFENPEVFTREVTLAFANYMPQISIIFSGKNQSHLASHLEKITKKVIFDKYPQYKDDIEKNILLSYCIHGAYNASLSNPTADTQTIVRVLENAVIALKSLY